MNRHLRVTVLTLFGCSIAGPAQTDDSARLLTIDHYVTVKSTVPAIAGQPATLYVREKVLAGSLARPLPADRVVLFVHGAGTPAEVAFDVPHEDYSWMAYLAKAGYDVFAMDTTGYGRSTRPAAMNDPCNLAKDRQLPFAKAPCAPSYAQQLTTIQSDWDDIGAVVDHLRTTRRVDKVSVIGWSLGGPRAVWGWTPALVGKTMIPTLLVAGIHDRQVLPQRVQELFTDLGATEKVLLDLGCASHNAMWEKNHTLLFKASLEWLSAGTVNGAKDGVVKLGY